MLCVALDDYKEYLQKEDYKPATVARYARIVGQFRSWVMVRDPECILSHDTLNCEYLSPDAVIPGRPKDHKTVRVALNVYRAYLNRNDFPSPCACHDPIDQVVEDYVTHLRDTAGFKVVE